VYYIKVTPFTSSYFGTYQIGFSPISSPPTSATIVTVTFDTQGGSAIDPVSVGAGSPVYRPDNPSKVDVAFDNWYTAETDGSAVAFPFSPDSDTTIYARWILAGQGSITLSFSGLPQDETTNLSGTPNETLSWRNGTLSVSVPDGTFSEAASYQWYLDNAPLSERTP
jgi:hypothetical protein